jgi:hypothetical protein
VVFPQLEHARLAAAIALAWGDDVAPLPLPRESYVAGVALHDRGYGEHDADEIGALPGDRWLATQRRGFSPRGADPIVDVVVAMHVRRLVSHDADEAALRALAEMDDALPALRAAAGVSEGDGRAADRITDLCDRVAFDFCLEEPGTGSVELTDAAGEAVAVRYEVDGRGSVGLTPWPLEPPRVSGVMIGYAADGYPGALDPVVVPFRVEPA